MRWIKNQRSGEYLFDGPIEWNMWQRKLAPFGELSTGDTVFLMRDAETFTEEVLVGDVLATEYQSKPHAWDLLTAQFPVLTTDPGISLDAFLRHTYTSGREDSGVILRLVLPVRPSALVATSRHHAGLEAFRLAVA